MTTKQKNTLRGKPTGVKGSRSSSDHDFTCSEAQLDSLLSEGESTGQTGAASRVLVNETSWVVASQNESTGECPSSQGKGG